MPHLSKSLIWRWSFYCLISTHLILVFGGACGWKPPKTWNNFGTILRSYGEISGADSGYGFFAPDVGPSYHATFTLYDQSGRIWTDRLENGAISESRLRLMSIIDKGFSLGMAKKSSDFRHRLAESLANAMFRKHPSAERVIFQVEAMVVPTMKEVGKDSGPKFVYQAEFAKQKQN